MTKQYWGDASTINCVWLFQIDLSDDENEEGFIKENWKTERVFLTREEARNYGKSRPYVWGEEGEGWRIYGVPCEGLMAEILGQNINKFKDRVDNP